MAMELEESFFSALIASEDVERWMGALRCCGRGQTPAALVRAKQALREMVGALTSEAYAEEARQAGAVPLLTSLLKYTEDEDILNDVSDVLAACSGFMATSGKTRTITYGGTPVTLKEGPLGDGVGAKVWTCAHTFCREMVRHPDIVAGRRVLEIGSGCGPCGILAAKLGADSVVLSDYVGAVLRNLRDCVHLNASQQADPAVADDAGTAAAAAGSSGSNGSAGAQGSASPSAANVEVAADGDGLGAAMRGWRQQAQEEAESWDPEDASECDSDDFDAFLGEAAGGGSAAQHSTAQHSWGAEQREAGQRGLAAAGPAAGEQQPWEAPPNMRVRFYDWQDSVDWLPPAERAALAASPGVPRSTAPAAGGSIDTGGNECGAPGMGLEEQYDVIIGTDVLYEWPMVLMVPAVIKHRLRPGGRAVLCCAVREQAMFDATLGAMAALGLRVGVERVQPVAEDFTDMKQEYEGGYVLLAVEHSDAPAHDWHRDDLFDRARGGQGRVAAARGSGG